MATYLQMLEMARIQGAQALQSIDTAMTRNLQIRQQAQQATTDMAYKAAAFAENQRLNNAKLDQINLDNEYRAKEWEYKMQMAPLEYESRHLELQARKIGFERQKEAHDLAAFSSISSIYDDIQAGEIIRTQNPDHAKESLDYKAQWLERVRRGEDFNGDDYSRGLSEINERYKDVNPETSEYSPEVSHFLHQFSPNVAKRYDTQNPLMAKNKNALASQYIGATPTNRFQFAERYGQLFNDEELGVLTVNSDIYHGNQQEIANGLSQIQKVQAAIRTIDPSDSDSEVNMEKFKIMEQEISNHVVKLQKQNQTILSNAARGIYANDPNMIDEIPEESRTPTEPRFPIGSDRISTQVFKTEDVPAGNITGSNIRQSLASIQNIIAGSIPIEESEIADVDMNWIVSRSTGNEPDEATKKIIKRKIAAKVDAIGADNLITPEKLNAIDKQIKIPIEVPIEVAARKHINEAFGLPYGQQGPQPVIKFLGESPDTWDWFNNLMPSSKAFEIRDYKDIQTIVDKIKDPVKKEYVRNELYSAYVTAGISGAVTK